MNAPASLPFTKLHGRGNDFVLLDRRDPEVAAADVAALAPFLADRRFGLGCDQVLVLDPVDPAGGAPAHLRMTTLNADGSEAEMCGNGIRAFAAYAWSRGIVDRALETVRIETPAGIRSVAALDQNGATWYRVGMGPATGTMAAIGADPAAFGKAGPGEPARPLWHDRWAADQALAGLADRFGPVTGGVGVAVGNPHLVLFVDDLAAIPLAHWGPHLERDPGFANGVNVSFVHRSEGDRLDVRVWERGAGATLACGTAACAVAQAAAWVADAEPPIRYTVHMPGGPLLVELADQVYLIGPATEVARGRIDVAARSAWKEAQDV